MYRFNIHLIRVPKSGNIREDVFEMIMSETFPELMKDSDS